MPAAIVIAFDPGPPATVDLQVATKERIQIVQRLGVVQQTQTQDLKLGRCSRCPLASDGRRVEPDVPDSAWRRMHRRVFGYGSRHVAPNGGADNSQSASGVTASQMYRHFRIALDAAGLANYSTIPRNFAATMGPWS